MMVRIPWAAVPLPRALAFRLEALLRRWNLPAWTGLRLAILADAYPRPPLRLHLCRRIAAVEARGATRRPSTLDAFALGRPRLPRGDASRSAADDASRQTGKSAGLDAGGLV